MIVIRGVPADLSVLSGQIPSGGLEEKILYILDSSSKVYAYASPEQLLFEVNLRRKIIDAAVDLGRSRLSFRTFRKSKCNEDFWERTDEGGFLSRPDVPASEAIRDIYINSGLYGTECATAMVIVYYKALVDLYPEELFNRMFPRIELANWHNLDSSLGIVNRRDISDYLPGDCRYFKNPEVDPQTPEWQGENVIDLGNGMYYGHGVGIGPEEYFIGALNKYRIPGAVETAYLMDSATNPNYRFLADRYLSFASGEPAGGYGMPWYPGV